MIPGSLTVRVIGTPVGLTFAAAVIVTLPVPMVNWFPVPPLIIIEPSTFVGCPPAGVEFVNLSSPIDSTYEIAWDFGDL